MVGYFGWRWFHYFWFSTAEFCFLYYFHVLLQPDAITFWLSQWCVWLVQEIFCIYWQSLRLVVKWKIYNLMKYALNFIHFKILFERYAWLKNAFILVFLHWTSRVVKLQASLGPPRFDILVLEFTKHKHWPRVLLSQEDMFLLSGFEYYRWLCYVLLLYQFCFQQFYKLWQVKVLIILNVYKT